MICFDASKVSGTQKYGYIGLKDSNGNGQQCEVKDTVPDFCGPDTTTTKRMSYPTKYYTQSVWKEPPNYSAKSQIEITTMYIH